MPLIVCLLFEIKLKRILQLLSISYSFIYLFILFCLNSSYIICTPGITCGILETSTFKIQQREHGVAFSSTAKAFLSSVANKDDVQNTGYFLFLCKLHSKTLHIFIILLS